ncbi:hypothetical protein BH09ACT6_BH09ACT6_13610 [soil metagenome]
MGSRAARTVRGLVAAVFATFVAALSHVAVGGSAPGIVGLALGLAFSVLVCVALAGRSVSTVRLGIAVGLSQLVFHLVFSLGESAGVTMTQMAHHTGMVSIVADSSPSAGADALLQGCSWMWAAHALATVLTVVALSRGEAAFWGLFATAVMRIRRFIMLPFVEPEPDPGSVAFSVHCEPARSHLKELGVFLGSLRHRGPPVPALTTL